jgi:hypothetical protein
MRRNFVPAALTAAVRLGFVQPLWGGGCRTEGLAGVKSLTRLYFEGTQVTDTGVAELRKTLSKCEIKR